MTFWAVTRHGTAFPLKQDGHYFVDGRNELTLDWLDIAIDVDKRGHPYLGPYAEWMKIYYNEHDAKVAAKAINWVRHKIKDIV